MADDDAPQPPGRRPLGARLLGLLVLAWCGLASCGLATPAQAAACGNWSRVTDTVGLYFPERGTFFLHDSDHSGFIRVVAFGGASPGLIGLSGDWDRSGFDSIGVYDPSKGLFRLKPGRPGATGEIAFPFGGVAPFLVPVAGDWTGKGFASVGLYDRQAGVFRLRNRNSAGDADLILPFGNPGETRLPIVGDWTGDRVTRVGLYDPATGTFHLRLTNDPRNPAYRTFRYGGGSSVKPIFGRWRTGGGPPGVAIARASAVLQRDTLSDGSAERTLHIAPQGGIGGQAPQWLAGRWRPDRCLTADQNTTPPTPDWARRLIFYEMRLSTFTEPGPLSPIAAATARLGDLQELGVTALSLTPVHEAPAIRDIRLANLYGPTRPDRLNPSLGTEAEFRAFVAQAHARGMHVLLDVVLHGLSFASPYVHPGSEAFPQDWFSHQPDGSVFRNHWGTAQFDWSSPGLRDWWVEKVGVGWVRRFDLDGFRMDLEPVVAGSPLWTEVQDRVKAATGKTILLVPEFSQPGRAYTYHMTQDDFFVSEFFSGKRKVPATARASPETFYTSGLSNHDFKAYFAQGRPAAFAYGMVLSPFVPRWLAGEEFNATLDSVKSGPLLYFSQLHWQQRDAARPLLQQVRRLIEIRRTCQDIVAPLDRPLNRVNIVPATAFSGTDLEPYTMWRDGASITVLARSGGPSGPASVVVPLDAMGMRQPFFRVTDLMARTSVVRSRQEVLRGLTYTVPQGGVVPLRLDGLSHAADESGQPNLCEG